MASNPQLNAALSVSSMSEPTGKALKFADGIDAYEAIPTGKTIHANTAILILPDVIGIWQNSQLIADQFAANGYYTFIPDLFNGDALTLNRPKGFDLMSWLANGSDGKNPHTYEAVDPIVAKAITYLREEKGVKKIGAVGYCFVRAKYVVRFLTPSRGLSVGFVAHPSFVEDAELAAIAGPFSIAAAETDQIFPADKRHKSEEILIKTKQPYQINLYSGTEHGFSVRCDVTNRVQRYAKEQAFLQAVAWFGEHLV